MIARMSSHDIGCKINLGVRTTPAPLRAGFGYAAHPCLLTVAISHRIGPPTGTDSTGFAASGAQSAELGADWPAGLHPVACERPRTGKSAGPRLIKLFDWRSVTQTGSCLCFPRPRTLLSRLSQFPVRHSRRAVGLRTCGAGHQRSALEDRPRGPLPLARPWRDEIRSSAHLDTVQE